MKTAYKIYAVFLIFIALLYGCSGSGSSPPAPEETRAQDSRTFTIDPSTLPFDALAGSTVETDRWYGILGNAGYRVEVPKTTWNGMLVMYAHGFKEGGDVSVLDAYSMPDGLRRYLLENGYAWAASSYSKNYYDVRAGIEDTNALALAFNNIAEANGRPLTAPTKIYIIGHSMGGHITAAAVEDETYSTANNKVHYNGAVPMCGVVGDTELFNYFTGSQLAAQKVAGFPATSFPSLEYDPNATNIINALFTTFPFPLVPTTLGLTFEGIIMNLTGGTRPMFDQGFTGPLLGVLVWGTFAGGGDGTISGILNKNGVDTNAIVYQFDADPTLTAEEAAFNASILRVTADPDANRLRRDGLRWIPKVNGNFSVPVVTIHTLGDMFVPFEMEEVYRTRANAGTGDNWLVQRAIRGVSHCDFTVAETVAAVEAMLDWEQHGIKPIGDDVLTAGTIGTANYGCQFTNNTTGIDDSPGIGAVRATLPACP